MRGIGSAHNDKVAKKASIFVTRNGKQPQYLFIHTYIYILDSGLVESQDLNQEKLLRVLDDQMSSQIKMSSSQQIELTKVKIVPFRKIDFFII